MENKNIYSKIILASVILLAFAFTANAKNNTSKYWKCEERIGGEWNFGRAPSACRIHPFQNESNVESYWKEITFFDTNSRSSERERYMTEMRSFITGMGSAYLKKRKPGVSSSELDAWTKALLALVHQESFWTHYRKASDSKLRMMRGDYGHGHGMMQIDDRWHFVQVKNGGAARIEDNMVYALDVMYDAWQRAASASCVSSSSNYTSRTRAMYSVYNGGSSKVCRWTNPNDTWARNDKNYWDKYNTKAWERYIANRETYEFNYQCLVQGGGLKCFDEEPPVVVDPPDDDTEGPLDELLSEKEIYTVRNDYHCTWNGSFLSCLPYEMGESAIQCLVDLWGLDESTQPRDLASVTSQNVETRNINPSKKCLSTSLAGIGSFVEAQVNINMRKTPGGDWVSVIKAGNVYQVLDNYVNSSSGIRYYLVSDGSKTGYVYGGTSDNAAYYFRSSGRSSAKQYVANIGDRIIINAPYGINLRTQADGDLILRVPNGERLDILSRVIRGDEKYVYYKVEYKNEVGYIYSGYLAPAPATDYWTEVE